MAAHPGQAGSVLGRQGVPMIEQTGQIPAGRFGGGPALFAGIRGGPGAEPEGDEYFGEEVAPFAPGAPVPGEFVPPPTVGIPCVRADKIEDPSGGHQKIIIAPPGAAEPGEQPEEASVNPHPFIRADDAAVAVQVMQAAAVFPIDGSLDPEGHNVVVELIFEFEAVVFEGHVESILRVISGECKGGVRGSGGQGVRGLGGVIPGADSRMPPLIRRMLSRPSCVFF